MNEVVDFTIKQAFEITQAIEITVISFETRLHEWRVSPTLRPSEVARIYSLEPGSELLKHLLLLILSDRSSYGIVEVTIEPFALKIKGRVEYERAYALANQALTLAGAEQ